MFCKYPFLHDTAGWWLMAWRKGKEDETCISLELEPSSITISITCVMCSNHTFLIRVECKC